MCRGGFFSKQKQDAVGLRLIRFQKVLFAVIGLCVPFSVLALFEAIFTLSFTVVIGIAVIFLVFALGIYAAKERSYILLAVYVVLNILPLVGFIIGIAKMLLAVGGSVIDTVAACSNIRVKCDTTTFVVVTSITLGYTFLMVGLNIFQTVWAWRLRRALMDWNESQRNAKKSSNKLFYELKDEPEHNTNFSANNSV
eukprot:TRINITY_DN2605_c0_g1_i1.p1 TRINITY_DN2605_c0_g1~~TRINITY_DN2605_c0_g1_i1.p1  ORF type:complete len:196 (-),score=55.15 TRINITY_DN2605_c0_g1_i1:44-631(-)